MPWIGFTIQHSPRRSRLCSAALNFVERSTQVERPFASAEGFGSLVASVLAMAVVMHAGLHGVALLVCIYDAEIHMHAQGESGYESLGQ